MSVSVLLDPVFVTLTGGSNQVAQGGKKITKKSTRAMQDLFSYIGGKGVVTVH